MSNIDLSKLQTGDKVRLYKEIEVEHVRDCGDGLYSLMINGSLVYYNQNGKAASMKELDISNIIPKPFDWEDDKYGMAFLFNESIENVWVLVGKDIEGKALLQGSRSLEVCKFKEFKDGDLTRSPENDIKEINNEY